jgi:hypothetical protein
MPKAPSKPSVSLRVRCTPVLYERISSYRHEARHESKNQALVALIAAGLAALAKPASVPTVSRILETDPSPSPPPDRPKQLVAYAGIDDKQRAAARP